MKRGDILTRLVAEFSVIVLGVMVALFFDGLREGRVERAYELQILEAVTSDLRANIEDLTSARSGTLGRSRLIKELLVRVDGTSRPPEVDLDPELAELGVGDLLVSLSLIRVFDPRTTGLLALEVSGSFGVIRSPDVRGSILEYYGQVDSWREGQTIDRALENRVKSALISAGVSTSGARFTEDSELLVRLRSSPSAQAALSEMAGSASGQSRYFGMLLTRTELLLDEVEDYQAEVAQ